MLGFEQISTQGANALEAALRGRYTLSLNDGEVMLVCDSLPGRAAAAATRKDGVLWLVVDLDKPLAARQGWAMLNDYWQELIGGVPLQLKPEPCPLSLVS